MVTVEHLDLNTKNSTHQKLSAAKCTKMEIHSLEYVN